MPHQCVRCSKFYDDGAKEIIKGCSCGGKLFFYIKKEKLDETKKLQKEIKLSEADKKQIEKDVFEIVGTEINKEEPVILDLESIKIKKPGQYELDLVSMFKGEPMIIKLADGKYMIDIAESFRAMKKEVAFKNRTEDEDFSKKLDEFDLINKKEY